MFSSKSLVLSKAFKRAMILHLLLYGEPIRLNAVQCISGADNVTLAQNGDYPLLWSMIDKPLLRKPSPLWKEKQYYSGFLTCNNPDLCAAINALLASKTKRFQTERFLYLWMSMNALYRHYSKQQISRRRYFEKEMISAFAAYCGYGEGFEEQFKVSKGSVSKVNSIILRRPVEEFLSEIRDNHSRSSYALYSTLGVEPNTFSAYGYFLLVQSYHHRCDLVHANREVKLLSFPEESEIIVLRTLGNMLEEFLDDNLHKWFSKEDREAMTGSKQKPDKPNMQNV